MTDRQSRPRHHALLERHRLLGILRDFLINFFAGIAVLFLGAAGITHVGFLQDRAADLVSALRPEVRDCTELPGIDPVGWGLTAANPVSRREFHAYRAALHQDLPGLWSLLQEAEGPALLGAMPELKAFVAGRAPAGGVADIRPDREFWRRVYGQIVTHAAGRFADAPTPAAADGSLKLPRPLLSCLKVDFDIWSRRVSG